MSSVKKNFAKGIGYIKRDIEILLNEEREIEEFLGYVRDLPYTPARQRRKVKEIQRLAKIRAGLHNFYEELAFYKDYFRYTQKEIDEIPVATDESIERDARLIEQELKDTSWTEEDHIRVFTKAGITVPIQGTHAKPV